MHKYILWQKKFRIKILVEINKVTQILEPTLHFQKCFFSPSPRQTVQNQCRWHPVYVEVVQCAVFLAYLDLCLVHIHRARYSDPE